VITPPRDAAAGLLRLRLLHPQTRRLPAPTSTPWDLRAWIPLPRRELPRRLEPAASPARR
jgi:hypothetical protein